jgi:hypothetical protein
MSRYRARLRLRLVDTKLGTPVIPDVVKEYGNLQHILGPGEIELRPGDTYRKVEIPNPLLAYPAVSQDQDVLLPRTVLVLTTDTPGVYYSFASESPSPDALSTPRVLADFSEEPHQTLLFADTPNYDDETPRWKDTSATTVVGGTLTRPRMKRVTDQPISYGGYAGHLPYDLNGGTNLNLGEARFIWGRANAVNLGKGNDSLVFCFWLKRQKGGAALHFQLMSYPYRHDTRESDLSATIGTPEDSVAMTAILPGEIGFSEPYAYVNISGHLTEHDDKWRLIQVRKPEFTMDQNNSTKNMDWTRVTRMSLACSAVAGGSQDGTEGIHFGPIFLMQEAQNMRRLDTAVVETLRWAGVVAHDGYFDRSGVRLILTAPPGRTAKVKYFMGSA